jgi:phenol 2-monooxygenase
MSEVAFWNPADATDSKRNSTGKRPGIVRTSFVPDVNVPARYQHEVTIHQGRIERILKENLDQYAMDKTIHWSHRFVDFKFDASQQSEYPVLVTVDEERPDGSTTRKSIRAKYLVGADGAHSRVRQHMGLKLEGETTDHIWGVVDFVADTDFPDIRKRCAIHSNAGSIMVIPRERIATGEYLTRLYVQIAGEVATDLDTTSEKQTNLIGGREKRKAVTLEYIFDQARKVLSPYVIKEKEGTTVDWWAAYQIGQRMTPKVSALGPDGIERVFIVGDGELSRFCFLGA